MQLPAAYDMLQAYMRLQATDFVATTAVPVGKL